MPVNFDFKSWSLFTKPSSCITQDRSYSKIKTKTKHILESLQIKEKFLRYLQAENDITDIEITESYIEKTFFFKKGNQQP